jgi:hypothetical protein
MAYKILSLDGGGSWAMIQARVLLDIYGDMRGHELLRNFDMAIANSGGSLVLASLCNDMLLSEIIDVFEDHRLREQVFSGLTLGEKLFKDPAALLQATPAHMGPKYSTQRKLTGLTHVLKEKENIPPTGPRPTPIVECYLDELPKIIGKESLQIIIVGYDYFRRRANFFRSNPDSNTARFGGNFYRVQLKYAIHSSSNAPVNYFDEPATISIRAANNTDIHSAWYWDGAVSGFNNPVLAGVVEALTNDVHSSQMRILSIGTGTGDKKVLADYADSTNALKKAIYEANKDNEALTLTDNSFSFTRDVKEMATSILGDPPDSATFIAYSVLHPNLSNSGHLVRINPCITPVLDHGSKKYIVPAVYRDKPDDFVELLKMDMDAVAPEQVRLITNLCDNFITNSILCLPNQLIRGDAENPDPSARLGYLTYAGAKKRWSAIDI